MKMITMNTLAAGPQGIAKPGTVLQVKDDDPLNAIPWSRAYSKELDDKPGKPQAPRGWTQGIERAEG